MISQILSDFFQVFFGILILLTIVGVPVTVFVYLLDKLRLAVNLMVTAAVMALVISVINAILRFVR